MNMQSSTDSKQKLMDYEATHLNPRGDEDVQMPHMQETTEVWLKDNTFKTHCQTEAIRTVKPASLSQYESRPFLQQVLSTAKHTWTCHCSSVSAENLQEMRPHSKMGSDCEAEFEKESLHFQIAVSSARESELGLFAAALSVPKAWISE